MASFQGDGLSIDDEYAILNRCCDWSPAESKQRRREAREYFDLYEDQLRQLDLEYSKTLGETWPYAHKSHRQLLDVIGVIRDLGESTTLIQVRQAIQANSNLIVANSSILDSVIYAALRVWLLVNFRAPENRSLGMNRPCVEWRENTCLKVVLNQVFPKSTTELTLSQRRLSPHFTIANMSSICGLKVKWASTLDDHLYLDRQYKVLRIFPDREWLVLKADAARTQTATSNIRITSAPLPAEVYEETSRTLDLLFPSWDKPTQRLLKRKGKTFNSLNSRNRMLDLKHYPYWKDRLLELNEDIFLGPPEGWAQLWNDRRDPQKFWTFWIALAVFTLTIASTIASVLQTWATLRTSK